MDILCGERCDLVELACISENAPRGLVIEHLKRLGSDDLKPMDKSFDACVRVEMSVRNDFLLEGDVLRGPAEQNGARDVNHSHEYGWICVNDE